MNTHRTNRSRAVRVVALATATATVGLGFFAAPALAKKPRPVPSSHTVVATGLNNPRGIATEGDNLVYVSEAGTGGTECITVSTETTCFGFTGSITRFEKLGKKKQRSTKVVDGLLSIQEGSEVVGIDGIDVEGKHRVFGVMSESAQGIAADFAAADGTPSPSPTLSTAISTYAGRLVEFRKKHGVFTPTALANVGGTNWDWTDAHKSDVWAPTNDFPDANPYAVVSEGNKHWVVDAGANTVTLVQRKKGVYTQKLISYIPNPVTGRDAAPACIAKRGRYLYVGELNFAAFYDPTTPTASATIYRIDTRATDPMTSAVAWATGLNPITGCGFAKNAFYVVQLRTISSGGTNGAITRIGINEDGTAAASGTWQTFGTDLVDPSGFAKLHNTILVANKSTSTGAGEIWQFRI